MMTLPVFEIPQTHLAVVASTRHDIVVAGNPVYSLCVSLAKAPCVYLLDSVPLNDLFVAAARNKLRAIISDDCN